MTRSLVFVFVMIAIVAIGEVFGPRPGALEETTAAMPSLLELHSMAEVHKLPLQDIEDQSLMYPTSTNGPKP